MAIKASCTVTLSCYRDTQSVTRYYKLQSSTASAPSKPTANPPSGWTDSEPSYTSGSTNTLYFCDLTVFSDGTWSYSTVSKSSSYEAAKEAYNKAQNAQNSVDNLEIGGRNLVPSNFLIESIANSGTTKEFTCSAWASTLISTENILSILEPSTEYVISYDAELVGRTDCAYKYDLHLGFLLYSPTTSSANIGFSSWSFTESAEIGDKCSKTDVFTTPSELPSDYRLLVYTRRWTSGANGGGTEGLDTIKFTDFKLEKGNRATDWTPAPEDVDAAINAKISNVDVEYYLSTSATSLSGGSWSTTAPTWVDGKYMWSRTKTTKGDGTVSYKPSETGTCIAGAKGSTGATGKGIKSIVEQYYKSTSATSLSGGSWSATYPGWENDRYIWTRSVITYTDNTTTTTTAVCVTGAKGSTGEKGDKGDTGASGKDAAIISSTEPTDKTYLWCDTSASPPLLKQWNGEEWIIVNDNAEQITRIYKEITNSITQASENILMQVGEKTYSKEAVDRLLSDMNTSFEQTKNSFNFEFNRFQTELNDLSNSTDTKFENTSKYIRFVNGEIYIGVEGNPIMLRLRNDRLSFLENNAEVAYVSNRTLYFTHAEVLKDLKIGRFAWVAMDSGYMALKLVE